jgi:nitrite reductase/ring-hydroxylating ferredoxin subunit
LLQTVAQLDDIPEGSMLGIEVDGEEIALANVEGTIYAVQGRCGHMNAPLAEGKLMGSTIICPLHYAQFDITTGKKIKNPASGPGPVVQALGEFMDQISDETKAAMAESGELMRKIKAHDLKTYPVQIDGTDVQIDL